MTQPIIGLTTYGIANDEKFTLPGEYVLGVIRAGGLPVLLPSAELESPGKWMDLIQGLVLCGGGDIDPARHGGAPHETVYNLDPDRDACEFELANLAIERNMPTLAICRGLQVVNILLGGTLHVHLPEVYGDKVPHRMPPRATVPHTVKVAEDAVIAKAMKTTGPSIVSWHHQAVDRLGEGLRPVAWAEDGVVEGLELDGHPNLLMVQWHPELSAADDSSQQRLFDRLVEMAGE